MGYTKFVQYDPHKRQLNNIIFMHEGSYKTHTDKPEPKLLIFLRRVFESRAVGAIEISVIISVTVARVIHSHSSSVGTLSIALVLRTHAHYSVHSSNRIIHAFILLVSVVIICFI